MPDNGRFSDREIERDLRDLGARIEYPPTPDLAQAVRRRIDEEDAVQHTPRGGFWPSFFSPRWAATAAALILIAVAAFSPAVRATLSDLFVSGEAASSGHQAEDGSEAGGSAARPEGGGPEDAGSSVASGAKASSADEVTGCPSPSLEAEPARAAPEAKFRLHGAGFSSGCDKIRPASDIRIGFRQDGKTWKLATVDADRDLTFDARLRVPAGARLEQATVRATTRSGELVEEHFVVSR
jgi:hypothetical protein